MGHQNTEPYLTGQVMKKSNAKEIDIKTVTTDEFVTPATMVATYCGYIGLDVHKDRIVYL